MKLRTAYYGWDGDRLVHTEHVDRGEGERRHIAHTIYEPHTFTPMVRLSTTSSALQDKPHALVQALQAGLEAGLDDPGQEDRQALAMVQGMLGAMPKQMQTDAAKVMQQVLAQGLPQNAMQLLGDEGETTAQRISHMREQLQKQEQAAQTPIKIEYYHCDHLGTPMALTDQQGRIAWAAKLDPWGNVQEEYNPGGIEQPIRLPGQHHDRETGLYYNRYRYYDPAIGAYINQDPIGLAGGANLYGYVLDPILWMDATGTSGWSSVPIFNGSLPGNQAALGTAIGGGAPVSTGGFQGAIVGKIMEGVQWGPISGITVAAGIGVSTSSGTATDQTGLTCMTTTICGIIGPVIGGVSNIGYATQTGKFTPGDVSWSLGGVGSTTVGWGGKAEFSIGTDGAIGMSGGASAGGIVGGGVQICRQVTSKNCGKVW